MQQTNRFTTPDVLSLLFATGLLLTFLLLPWMQVSTPDANLSAVGARFLLDEPVVDFEDSTTASLIPEESVESLSTIVNRVDSVVGLPDLVILGAIIGIIGSLWSLLDTKTREITALIAGVGGLMAVLYFISFFAANRFSGIDVIGYMGFGFWLSVFFAGGLLLQVVFPRPQQETTPRIEFLKRTLWNNRVYIVILILLIALPHLVAWQTDSSPFAGPRGIRGRSGNIMSLMIEIFSLAILVMSYNLMFGFTGVISFGHALFFGIGTYSVGIMIQFSGLDPNTAFWLSILIAMVLAGVIGLLMGLASLRLSGIYFAIFTLALAEAGFIFVKNWQLTNKDTGFSVSDIPDWISPVQGRINLYYFSLLLFVLSFFIIQKLVNSPMGTVFKAIRENEERAQAIGYPVIRYKLVSITLASVLAAVAGIILGILNSQQIGPTSFGVNKTVEALLMTIIGGTGTLTGPVLGAAGLHSMDFFLRDSELMILGISVSDNWPVITGLIFVFVVLVFPYGVVGTWHRIQIWLSGLRGRKPFNDDVTLTNTSENYAEKTSA
jgi:branched-chain amino acid transport system permease protein